jgi:hypothetical protein
LFRRGTIPASNSRRNLVRPRHECMTAAGVCMYTIRRVNGSIKEETYSRAPRAARNVCPAVLLDTAHGEAF